MMFSVLSQVKNIFPDLVTTHRCSMHAAQKSMENALKTDNQVATVLDLLIFRFSKPNNAKEPGSLSRAINNSSKLKAKFGNKVQASMAGVDELIGRVYSASHAPQRFDSILLALQLSGTWKNFYF